MELFVKSAFLLAIVLMMSGCGVMKQSANMETEADEMISETKQIVLCTGAYGNYLRQLVEDYNACSDSYEITVLCPENGEKSVDFRNRIQLELTAGNGPDVLDIYALQNMDWRPYAEKGYLENVSEFLMQKNENSVLKETMNYYKTENGIYGVPFRFHIQSLVTSLPVECAKEEWTIERCMKEVENSGASLFCTRPYGWDGDEAGMAVLEYLGVGVDGVNAFVDIKNGDCSFDSELFCSVLEFAKEYADSKSGKPYSGKLQDGKVFCAAWSFTSFLSFWDLSEYCGGKDPISLGFPSENGSVCGLHVDGMLVNAASQNKQGVYDFLRFILSEDEQRKMFEQSDGHFPANEAVLRQLWNDAEKEVFRIEKILNMDGTPKYQERLIKPEEEKMFWAMLEQSIPFYKQSTIEDIVWEEALPYFQNKIAATEVEEKIQNRVKNYLKEQ